MKYRKKPVVVEAFKWEGKMNDLPQWAYDGFDNKVMYFKGQDMGIYINTLEGTHYANVGDYIIQGIRGEMYPCKPDIFEQTYEPVECEENDYEFNPCGFCGGKPYENMAGIFCEDCGMGVSRYGKTNKQVVDAWNNWDVETY